MNTLANRVNLVTLAANFRHEQHGVKSAARSFVRIAIAGCTLAEADEKVKKRVKRVKRVGNRG